MGEDHSREAESAGDNKADPPENAKKPKGEDTRPSPPGDKGGDLQKAIMEAQKTAKEAKADEATRSAVVRKNASKTKTAFSIFFLASIISIGWLVWLLDRANSEDTLTVVAHAVKAGAPESRSATFREQTWLVSGIVISGNNLEKKPQVFAVLTDRHGNTFGSSTIVGNGDGPDEKSEEAQSGKSELTFEIPIKQRFDNQRPTVSEIVVSAVTTKNLWITETFSIWSWDRRATTTLDPEMERGSRWTEQSATPFLLSVILLAVTFVLSIWPTVYPNHLYAQYYIIVFFALVFTGSMIIFISTTSQELAGSERTDEVISLGFAHVFFGTYVEDTDSEWLLSLTTPTRPTAARDHSHALDEQSSNERPVAVLGEGVPLKQASQPSDETSKSTAVGGESKTEHRETISQANVEGIGSDAQDKSPQTKITETRRVSQGFGAPLWVLLLAVVGSALYLIRLVVDSLKMPIPSASEDIRAASDDIREFREKMSQIVRHQVYILFSPLSAIFVYQFLVAAGSASKAITVGLLALAAGIALNALLEKAWTGAGDAIRKG